jgi:triphosphoribosyl-dephospho-CoA synthase
VKLNGQAATGMSAGILPERGQAIGRAAVRALYQELAASPKPGLVSLDDPGSHCDMDARLMLRSLFALRHYFRDIAQAGARQEPFEPMRQLGLRAERNMLAATRGVNTHRGAIFSLGLLAAAAGGISAERYPLTADALARMVRVRFGDDIRAAARHAQDSHGKAAARRFGAGGAREEAAAGFPTVFGIGLPAYRQTLNARANEQAAAVQCLFALMAELEDTNLLYRGGLSGLEFARAHARSFLASGGVFQNGWQARSAAIHREFVARRLSPGGSADLLAATLFVQETTGS